MKTATNHFARLKKQWDAILPASQDSFTTSPKAWIQGKPAEVNVAIDHLHQKLTNANRPAAIGLENLSMQAITTAIDLMKIHHGSVLVNQNNSDLPMIGQPVLEIATLDAALCCDLLLDVGHVAKEYLADFLDHQTAPPQLEVATDLDTIIDLRLALKNKDLKHELLQKIFSATRIVITLTPQADVRVVNQWHKLAGEIQYQTRASVLQWPNKKEANRRGALEVLLWETGCFGGARYTGSQGKWTPHLDLQNVDVCLEFGNVTYNPTNKAPCRLRIGQLDTTAEVCITLPILAPNMQGHIMRFDAQVLPLNIDPHAALPDLADQILTQLKKVAQR